MQVIIFSKKNNLMFVFFLQLVLNFTFEKEIITTKKKLLIQKLVFEYS